jgi:uncharacterized protein with GYD domain
MRLMALFRYSPAATKGMMESGVAERESYLRKYLEDVGATIEAMYYLGGGEWDLVIIGDFPDTPASLIAAYFTNNGLGIYNDFRWYPAATGAEVDSAVRVEAVKMPGAK